MLPALDSSFVSCCSIVQFYEMLLVSIFRYVISGVSIAGHEMTDILLSSGLLPVIGVVRSGLGSLGVSNRRGAIVKSGEASSRAS